MLASYLSMHVDPDSTMLFGQLAAADAAVKPIATVIEKTVMQGFICVSSGPNSD
jgi:hypothetical protein